MRIDEEPINIAGPCILKIGAAYYESKDNVTVTLTDEIEEVKTIARGKLADRLKSRKVEGKFKPVKYSDFSVLFAVLNKVRSSLLLGGNHSIEIYGSDGICYVFPRACITGWPSIGLGVSQEFLGEFTFVGFPDPRKQLDDIASIYVRKELAMPALPVMTRSDIEGVAYVAIYGDLEEDGFAFDLEEGATIDFDIKLSDVKMDRIGVYDQRLGDIGVSTKFKPTNTSINEWEDLVGLKKSPRLGGIAGAEKDLILRGIRKGDPMFTLKNVSCTSRGLVWSDEASRLSEVNLNVNGNMGIDKLTFGLAPEDFLGLAG